MSIVNAVIQDNQVHQPQEAVGRDIAAFSYFYDLALDAGLISSTGYHGVTTVGDYKKAAQDACSLTDQDSFACVDLTFTYALFTSGYGFSEAKQIQLYKKINGHEASWALGVGYNIIHNQ
jgi:hypothetical protein